ncbi:MAG TPA: hypothetical protein VM848_08035 [Acidimicrobiia bacterium]|nr:hypothetical protein [Acidimicrobiia bacterium]
MLAVQSALFAQMPGELLAEVVQVIDPRRQHLYHPPVVHAGVMVDKKVAEPGGSLKGGGDIFERSSASPRMVNTSEKVSVPAGPGRRSHADRH